VCDSQWVLTVPSDQRASQRELICCLSFPSRFPYNPKFRQTHCSVCHLISRWFLARLILRVRRWKRNVPPKREPNFNGLHGVTSQKTYLFITTTVRTSNPNFWPPLHAEYHVQLTRFELPTLTTSSLCNFLYSPVRSSLLSRNILPRTPKQANSWTNRCYGSCLVNGEKISDPISLSQ
jgi:hypothetical protein